MENDRKKFALNASKLSNWLFVIYMHITHRSIFPLSLYLFSFNPTTYQCKSLSEIYVHILCVRFASLHWMNHFANSFPLAFTEMMWIYLKSICLPLKSPLKSISNWLRLIHRHFSNRLFLQTSRISLHDAKKQQQQQPFPPPHLICIQIK